MGCSRDDGVVAGRAGCRAGAALETVLARAGAYVAEFQRQLSGHRRRREVRPGDQGGRRARCDARGMPVATRAATAAHASELRSDLLLVKPGGADGWMAVPRRVRGRRRAGPRPAGAPDAAVPQPDAASADAQIGRILDESARYNIGDIRRNVNTPVYPLLFLEPANQFRFKFKRTNDARRPRPSRRTRRETARSASRPRSG